MYIAVTPIIAFTARIPNGHMIGVILAFVYGYGGMFAAGNMSLANLYPITASMGLIQYRSHDAAVHWNIGVCSLRMIVVLLISVAIVVTTKNVSSAKVVKKPKKTVLIVEDEVNIVDIVRFNLQREGYATLEAYDG